MGSISIDGIEYIVDDTIIACAKKNNLKWKVYSVIME